MVKINLLPHREAKRKQKRQAFYAMLFGAVVCGVAILAVGGGVIEHQIAYQNQRNAFIQAENAKLDKDIREVAALKQEIEGLKARQKAVEDLQSDRNQPVHLMDELVKQVPEGIYLKSFRQSEQRVSMNGLAESNERVSEFLRNLSNNSSWLHRPELVEIRAVQGGKAARRIYDFTITVSIKRAGEQQVLEGGSSSTLSHTSSPKLAFADAPQP